MEQHSIYLYTDFSKVAVGYVCSLIDPGSVFLHCIITYRNEIDMFF